MASSAVGYKELGNKAFGQGDFKEAERMYTIAIQKDPENAIFFTNRAFSRIKMESWDPCIDDCLSSIELNSGNMKAFYYLAQAQLALRHPNEAVSSALTAYDLCLRTGSASTPSVVALVLQAKKTKWEFKERERLRQRSQLLADLEDYLESRTDHEDSIEEARARSKHEVEELRSIFAIADPTNMKRREVPDYMIDSITFAFMHDPVTTRNGHSYERATIEAHLKTSDTDPLTREPLRREDLRPNLALKQACAEFLEGNGWAVEW